MKRDWDPGVCELMDQAPSASPEFERDLTNLEHLNRFFGSHLLSWRFLGPQIAAGKVRTLLDLATGGGDLPRFLAQQAISRGAQLSIDAIDFQPATLEIASRRTGQREDIRFSCGDIRTEPAEGTWDAVHCSLALHHFSEEDAVRILRLAAARAARFVLVTDLRRSVLATLGIWLITATVFREPMTRHDALLSARRAFSFPELRDLARRSGWMGFRHGRAFCFRQFLWLEKAQPSNHLHQSPPI